MTQLTPDEIQLVSSTGTNVVHCPTSNLKLASGICPVAQLLDAGVNVALGTDSASSNNSLDMFAEMKLAAILAKGCCDYIFVTISDDYISDDYISDDYISESIFVNLYF